MPKRSLVLFVVGVLFSSLVVIPAQTADATGGYVDVPDGTYYTDAVEWSVEFDITDITSDYFAPAQPSSRGEIAVWIWRMAGQQDAPAHAFTDLPASQSDAVAWLLDQGVTTGTSPTTFSPSRTLTRAELAAFLWRLAGEPTADPHSFGDVVKGWQQNAVSWLATSGITTGTSPTTFSPARTLSRAELITFLYRYNQRYPTETSQNVVCGEGLVKLDEYVTETDNGCRRADCYGGGRNENGECRSYGEWLDTLVRDCPTVDTSDGLGAYGGDIFILGEPDTATPGLLPIIDSEPADLVFPQMVPGSSWIAEIQFVDNANWDWKPGGVAPNHQWPYFGASVGAGIYVPRVVGGSNGMLWTSNQESGSQTVEFTVPANKPLEPAFRFGASARGAGCWAVRFTRTS